MAWEPQFPEQIDAKITQWIMSLWRKSAFLDAAMIVLGKWTPIVMLTVIVVASTGWLLPISLHTLALKSAAAAVFTALLARVINEPISRWANRPRPFERELSGALLDHEEGRAFPSNHATGAFALAMSFSLLPGYHAILVGLALLLAMARVYNGLHHTTDVIAGMLHGTIAAWLLLAGFRWLGWM